MKPKQMFNRQRITVQSDDTNRPVPDSLIDEIQVIQLQVKKIQFFPLKIEKWDKPF